jgi:hypothetical protein
MSPEAKSNAVTLRITYGIIPEKKWHLSQSGCGIKSGINTTFLARNCGSVAPRAANSSCPLVVYWLQRIHAPGAAHPDRGRWGGGARPGGTGDPKGSGASAGQHLAQAGKRDAAEAAAQSQQQPVALLVAMLAAAQRPRPQRPAASCDSRRTGRQQREARAGCQHQYDDTEQACATPSVINLVSPDLVPPSSPPSGAQANPIDAETDQASEGKHRRRASFLN